MARVVSWAWRWVWYTYKRPDVVDPTTTLMITRRLFWYACALVVLRVPGGATRADIGDEVDVEGVVYAHAGLDAGAATIATTGAMNAGVVSTEEMTSPSLDPITVDVGLVVTGDVAATSVTTPTLTASGASPLALVGDLAVSGETTTSSVTTAALVAPVLATPVAVTGSLAVTGDVAAATLTTDTLEPASVAGVVSVTGALDVATDITTPALVVDAVTTSDGVVPLAVAVTLATPALRTAVVESPDATPITLDVDGATVLTAGVTGVDVVGTLAVSDVLYANGGVDAGAANISTSGVLVSDYLDAATTRLELRVADTAYLAVEAGTVEIIGALTLDGGFAVGDDLAVTGVVSAESFRAVDATTVNIQPDATPVLRVEADGTRVLGAASRVVDFATNDGVLTDTVRPVQYSSSSALVAWTLADTSGTGRCAATIVLRVCGSRPDGVTCSEGVFYAASTAGVVSTEFSRGFFGPGATEYFALEVLAAGGSGEVVSIGTGVLGNALVDATFDVRITAGGLGCTWALARNGAVL